MNWFKRLWWGTIALVALIACGVAWTWQPDRQLGELVARWASEPSQFLELDGMQVHVRDTGPRSDEPPILLLHGMASSLHSFEGWQARLQAQHRVISVDLPGFGLTGPSPQGDYRIDAYTRFILKLLDTLEIKRVVIAGNALGGEIAWQTALLAPERVHKLILIDSDGYEPSVLSMPLGFQVASMKGLRWVAERIMPRLLMTASLRSVFGDPDRITAERIDRYFELNLRVGNRRALFQRMDQANFGKSAALIRRITQPTLVLWGERDEMISPELGARFCEDISRCKLVTFPKLGHLPQEEDPDITLQAVLPFLSS